MENFIPFRAAEGSEDYGMLRSKYEIRGLPKEAIVDKTGKIVDKIGSFDSPDDFFERVKKSLKGTDTLAGLQEEYEKNPENLFNALKLAIKYNNIYKRDNAVELLDNVLKKPDEIKSIFVPYGTENEKVNGYEYAKFLHARVTFRNRGSKIPEFGEFIKEFPNSRFYEEAYVTLANFYKNYQEDEDRAEEFINSAIKKFPDNNRLPDYFVDFSIRTGRNLKKAEEITKGWIKKNPENIYAYRYAASVYLKMGKDEKAFEVFGENFCKKYIYSKPDDGDKASLLNTYAWYWAPQGKNLKSAEKASKKSLEIRPDAHAYWDTLSMIYWKMKNYDKAIETEEKALELNPNQNAYKNQIEAIKKDKEKNN